MKTLISSVAIVACLSGCTSADKPAETPDSAEKAGCTCGDACKCDACSSGDHDACTCSK